MYQRSRQTRDKIIRSTIELMLTKDIGTLKIRDIAQVSNIGIGLINYHFQSKDNLINVAVQTFIIEKVAQGEVTLQTMDLPAPAKLKLVFKGYADFLATYPKIARMAMLNILVNESTDETTAQAGSYYHALLGEVFPNRNSTDLIIIFQQILAALQMTFLRAGELKQLFGMDFFDDGQREQLVEKLITNLL